MGVLSLTSQFTAALKQDTTLNTDRLWANRSAPHTISTLAVRLQCMTDCLEGEGEVEKDGQIEREWEGTVESLNSVTVIMILFSLR